MEIELTALLCEKRANALVMTLNRPQVLNALSVALVGELVQEVERAGSRDDIRAVVITGAGSKAFSCGMDLKERKTFDQQQRVAQSRSLIDLGRALHACPKPVIAAIGGWCLGGGFELALFCDIRIAAEDAVFGFPEMTLGAYPGSGGAALLPRLTGTARAMEIFFTARRFDARTALAYGLAQRVVSRDSLLDASLELAQEFDKTSPLAVTALKRSILQGLSLPLDAAVELDQAYRRPLDLTRDYGEGLAAHHEKRSPRFVGQ